MINLTEQQIVKQQIAKQNFTEKSIKLVYPNTRRLIIFISYNKTFSPIISIWKIKASKKSKVIIFFAEN